MKQLIQSARAALQHCYAPYSQFRVAAAVLDEQGRIHTGVNVENSSYGLTQCAERSAICTAIGAGAREIKTIVVYTPTEQAHSPCGACRQFIKELGPDAKIVSVCDTDALTEHHIDDLLPAAFDLDSDREQVEEKNP